jgi:choline transport protein
MLPILLLLIKRIRGEQVPYGPWRLGRWGLPLNLVAVVYSLFTMVWMFFPAFIPVTPANMNWTVVVFFGSVLISIVCWFVYGNRSYHGPVQEVDVWTANSGPHGKTV